MKSYSTTTPRQPKRLRRRRCMRTGDAKIAADFLRHWRRSWASRHGRSYPYAGDDDHRAVLRIVRTAGAAEQAKAIADAFISAASFSSSDPHHRLTTLARQLATWRSYLRHSIGRDDPQKGFN